jgi:NIMA (never in mitosis gene a)-related kinase 1/4/5
MTWFVQIVMAIEFMHNQRTIHRDIKSENILLDKDGMIKLADFGTAKRFKTANLGQTQRVKGTPLYMCPEMF